jgi:SAM-dependent methyltransferase
MLIKLLKYIRDAQLVWDVMGSVYNRRIYTAITELYQHIAREIETAGKASILDAGAGSGFMSFLLAARNPAATVTGIDYSPMQVRAAERLRRGGESPIAVSAGAMSWISGSTTKSSMQPSASDRSNTGRMVPEA